jgi:hypothetical protein
MRWIAAVGVVACLGFLPAPHVSEFTDWSPAVNLGPTVNTRYVDSCVTISKDGLSLIFSSNRQAPGTMNRDLYLSKRADKAAAWGAPEPLAALNTSAWESCPALGLDEHELYFTSDRPGGCGGTDLWVAHRHDPGDDFGWDQPLNLGCAKDGYVNSNREDLMPTFFEDDEGHVVMYFASDSPGSKFLDLYQSVMRGNGTFAPPTPVAELSTHDADSSPAVRRDGLEIIFVSDRAGGSGVRYSMDFWTATRASTAEPWSAPVFVPSLGSPAWAGGRIALSFDGRELYFASSRVGRIGSSDLWVATRAKVGR